MSGSPWLNGLRARPRFQWFVPAVTTRAPLGAVYFAMCEMVEPGVWNAPLPWIRLPVTGELASVFTPAGSRPFATRASHSQPTIDEPMDVEVPGRCVSRPV